MLRALTSAEANHALNQSWWGGKNRAQRRVELNFLDSEGTGYVEVEMPLDAIRENKSGDRYDGTVDPERLRRYAILNIRTPIFLTFGKRSIQNGRRRAAVMDGGHRISAARLRGDKTIPAIMRKSELDLLLTCLPAGSTVRPATDSTGRRLPHAATGVDAFWKWFAGSKACDAMGRPVLAFHGTDSSFDTFNECQDGIFFSQDPKYASEYAGDRPGANVIPVYLRMTNPFVITEAEIEAGQGHLASELQDLGYDGLIVLYETNADYAVFSPQQIKSATGNDGSFDFSDPTLIGRFHPAIPVFPNNRYAGQSVHAASLSGFPGSTLVDKLNQPLIAYHGTGNQFDHFRGPTYFTMDPFQARDYAVNSAEASNGVARIIPAFLNLRKPAVVDDDYIEWAGNEPSEIQRLHAEGYDGMVNPSLTEIVVFSPEQIMCLSQDLPRLRDLLPSPFRAIHPTQSGIQAFKRWFADSKVVDRNGAPLIVYHGTAGDIESFDIDFQGRTFDHLDVAVPRDGFWFSSDPSDADWYSGVAARATGESRCILPVYLSLQNPFVVPVEEYLSNGVSGLPSQHELVELGYDGMVVALAEEGPEDPAAGAFQLSMFEKYPGKNYYQWPEADRAHYDRLLEVPIIIKHIHYVAFDPCQIKSAIGNDGSFDPSDPTLIGSAHPTALSSVSKERQALIASAVTSNVFAVQRVSQSGKVKHG